MHQSMVLSEYGFKNARHTHRQEHTETQTRTHRHRHRQEHTDTDTDKNTQTQAQARTHRHRHRQEHPETDTGKNTQTQTQTQTHLLVYMYSKNCSHQRNASKTAIRKSLFGHKKWGVFQREKKENKKIKSVLTRKKRVKRIQRTMKSVLTRKKSVKRKKGQWRVFQHVNMLKHSPLSFFSLATKTINSNPRKNSS